MEQSQSLLCIIARTRPVLSVNPHLLFYGLLGSCSFCFWKLSFPCLLKNLTLYHPTQSYEDTRNLRQVFNWLILHFIRMLLTIHAGWLHKVHQTNQLLHMNNKTMGILAINPVAFTSLISSMLVNSFFPHYLGKPLSLPLPFLIQAALCHQVVTCLMSIHCI